MEIIAKLLLDYAPASVLLLDPQGGCRYASRAARIQLDWESCAPETQSLLSRIHPLDVAQVTSALRLAVRSASRTMVVALRLSHRDGSWRTMEMRVSRTPVDDEGFFLAALLVDIDDNQRSQDALRESEGRLRQLLEEAPVGLGAFDAEGALLLGNQRFMSFLRSADGEHQGWKLTELVDAEYAPELAAALRDLLALRCYRVSGMTLGPNPDGAIDCWRVSAQVLDEGQPQQRFMVSAEGVDAGDQRICRWWRAPPIARVVSSR